LLNLSVTPEQFAAEAKFLLAAKLYELGRLSSGQAARLAGKERVEFLFALRSVNLPTSNLTPDELEQELNFALND
jgi:predicted HTH domain antitoxin